MKYKIYLFLVLGIIYTGCKEKHTQNEDTAEASHAHEMGHSEPKVLLTAYNSEIELFAESDPLVVGKESKILSHFTTLKNFKPIDPASITIKLKSGNTEIEQKIDKSEKKGIYSFTLTPKEPGNSKLTYQLNTGGKTVTIEIPVIVFKSEDEADQNAESQEINNPNAISFTKEKSWKIDFATEPAIRETFGQVIKTTGQVIPSQDDEVLITAKISGIINYQGNNALEGENVTTGESILNIVASGMAKNNSSVEFIEAKNNFENARTVYERQKELAKDKIVSEKELLNSKREYDNYKAIFDNLNQNFNTSGQSIKSPITGFIAKVFKRNGEYIEAGEPLLSIVKNKTLLIKADVQSRFSQYLSDISSAIIKSGDKVYTLKDLNGKIISIGKSLTPDNFAVPVTMQIENSGQFIPGEFVQLYLKSNSSKLSLVVPNSSLLEEQGLYFLLVQLTPEMFEKREVKTGASDGLKTEIISGLNENERIVSKGAMLIKLSQASGALDPHAGHVH